LLWQFTNNNVMSAIPYAIFKKDFRWEKHIGKGSCAQVNQYYHEISKQSYAVKRIELKSHDEFVQAFNEIEVIRLMDDDKATKVKFVSIIDLLFL